MYEPLEESVEVDGLGKDSIILAVVVDEPPVEIEKSVRRRRTFHVRRTSDNEPTKAVEDQQYTSKTQELVPEETKEKSVRRRRTFHIRRTSEDEPNKEAEEQQNKPEVEDNVPEATKDKSGRRRRTFHIRKTPDEEPIHAEKEEKETEICAPEEPKERSTRMRHKFHMRTTVGENFQASQAEGTEKRAEGRDPEESNERSMRVRRTFRRRSSSGREKASKDEGNTEKKSEKSEKRERKTQRGRKKTRDAVVKSERRSSGTPKVRRKSASKTPTRENLSRQSKKRTSKFPTSLLSRKPKSNSEKTRSKSSSKSQRDRSKTQTSSYHKLPSSNDSNDSNGTSVTSAADSRESSTKLLVESPEDEQQHPTQEVQEVHVVVDKEQHDSRGREKRIELKTVVPTANQSNTEGNDFFLEHDNYDKGENDGVDAIGAMAKDNCQPEQDMGDSLQQIQDIGNESESVADDVPEINAKHDAKEMTRGISWKLDAKEGNASMVEEDAPTLGVLRRMLSYDDSAIPSILMADKDGWLSYYDRFLGCLFGFDVAEDSNSVLGSILLEDRSSLVDAEAAGCVPSSIPMLHNETYSM